MTQMTLPAGACKQLPVDGLFLFLKTATAPITVSVVSETGNRSTYPLDAREQLRFNDPMRTLEVLNTSGGPVSLEILNGWGQFIPNSDGQHVILDGGSATIEVHTATGQPLEVIGGLTDEELRATPVATIASISDTFGAGIAIVGSGVIAANPARRGVIIKTLKANTGTVWTGPANSGLALESGDSLTVHTTAAITLTATVLTDRTTYAEF